MTNGERNAQDIQDLITGLRKFNEELKKTPNCLKCNKLLTFDNLGWQEKGKEITCNKCLGQKDFFERWIDFNNFCLGR